MCRKNKHITCLDADGRGIRFKAMNGRLCEHVAAAAAAARVSERKHRLRMVLELPE